MAKHKKNFGFHNQNKPSDFQIDGLFDATLNVPSSQHLVLRGSGKIKNLIVEGSVFLNDNSRLEIQNYFIVDNGGFHIRLERKPSEPLIVSANILLKNNPIKSFKIRDAKVGDTIVIFRSTNNIQEKFLSNTLDDPKELKLLVTNENLMKDHTSSMPKGFTTPLAKMAGNMGSQHGYRPTFFATNHQAGIFSFVEEKQDNTQFLGFSGSKFTTYIGYKDENSFSVYGDIKQDFAGAQLVHSVKFEKNKEDQSDFSFKHTFLETQNAIKKDFKMGALTLTPQAGLRFKTIGSFEGTLTDDGDRFTAHFDQQLSAQGFFGLDLNGDFKVSGKTVKIFVNAGFLTGGNSIKLLRDDRLEFTVKTPYVADLSFGGQMDIHESTALYGKGKIATTGRNLEIGFNIKY